MNMKAFKMSLENIQGKLSRAELRKVMAGSNGTQSCVDFDESNCNVKCTNGFNQSGTCEWVDVSGLRGCFCMT